MFAKATLKNHRKSPQNVTKIGEKGVFKAASEKGLKKNRKSYRKVLPQVPQRAPKSTKIAPRSLSKAVFFTKAVPKVSQEAPRRLRRCLRDPKSTKKVSKNNKKLLENHAENIHTCCKILQKLYRKFTHTCFAARCCAKFFLARRTGRKPTWITS